MLYHSLLGLCARGFRLLSCSASARIAVVWEGEYPRRCASPMMAAATSRGLELGVTAPSGVPTPCPDDASPASAEVLGLTLSASIASGLPTPPTVLSALRPPEPAPAGAAPNNMAPIGIPQDLPPPRP